MSYKRTILAVLILFYIVFSFIVSSYNTYPLFHWDGAFWGWESSLIQILNLFDSKLYLDKILVYPPFSTFLINILSESQSTYGSLFIENYVNHISFLICGIVIYIIFSEKFDFYTSTIASIFTVFYASTIVNPITYNSISLAISFLVFYFVFFNTRIVISSILISILLLTKQTYSIGIFAGLITVALINVINNKNCLMYLKIIIISLIFHVTTLLLLSYLEIIDMFEYIKHIYMDSASQKGGILNLLESLLYSAFRIFLDEVFILTLPITSFFILFERYIIKVKFIKLTNQYLNNIFYIIIISILLFSVTLLTNFQFNLTNSIYLTALKQVVIAFLVQYTIFNFVLDLVFKNYNNVIINYNFYKYLFFSIVFSLFIHLSSKVSHLMSYPSTLIIIFLWYFLLHSKIKIFNFILLGFIFPTIILVSSNGNNISKISLFDKNWEYAVTQNAFNTGVKFYSNYTFDSLSKYSNKSFITIPDNPPINSLFNSSYTTKDSYIPNKFVDMFSDHYLENELILFDSNVPDYVFIINQESWKNWYHKYVRANSASESYNDHIINYTLNNFIFLERITTNKNTIIDVYEKK